MHHRSGVYAKFAASLQPIVEMQPRLHGIAGDPCTICPPGPCNVRPRPRQMRASTGTARPGRTAARASHTPRRPPSEARLLHTFASNVDAGQECTVVPVRACTSEKRYAPGLIFSQWPRTSVMFVPTGDRGARGIDPGWGVGAQPLPPVLAFHDDVEVVPRPLTSPEGPLPDPEIQAPVNGLVIRPPYEGGCTASDPGESRG